MDTLAAISRWLGKQHVITGASRVMTSCGAPMRFTFTTRITSPFIC